MDIVAAWETVLGFYGEQVVPRIINVACATRVHKPLRQRICKGLVGDVVEIGVTRLTYHRARGQR